MSAALIVSLRQLVADGLHESAILLANFLLSSQHTHSPDVLALLGDCYNTHQYREYRRAIHYYTLATSALTKSGILVNDDRHTALIQSIVDCHLALNDADTAIKFLVYLENHGAKLSIKHLSLLARHWQSRGDKEKAKNYYAQIVKLQPLAIEALLAMIALGTTEHQSQSSLSSLSHSLSSLAPSQSSLSQDVSLFVRSQQLSMSYHYVESCEILSQLANNHSQSAMLARVKALTQYQCYDNNTVTDSFAHCYRLDPFMLDDIELYGIVLSTRGKKKALAELRAKLLAIDSQFHSQCYSVAALDADSEGLKADCEKFLMQATALTPQNSHTHFVRGYINLYTYQLPSSAVQYYWQALTVNVQYSPLTPVIHLTQGYVHALLANQQLNKSLHAVNALLVKNRKNPKLLTLTAYVLAHSQGGVEKARRALVKALMIDPCHVSAALSLADLYCTQGEYEQCLAMLAQCLNNRGAHDDAVNAKIGQVRAWQGDRAGAIHAYSRALQIDGTNAIALRGMIDLEEDSQRGEPADRDDDDNDANASAQMNDEDDAESGGGSAMRTPR